MTSTSYGAVGRTEMNEDNIIQTAADTGSHGETNPNTRERSTNVFINGEVNAGFSTEVNSSTSPTESPRHVSFCNSSPGLHEPVNEAEAANENRTSPARHVSFCEFRDAIDAIDVEQETSPESSHVRMRNNTGSTVGYQTHSEAEECEEDDAVSIVLRASDSGTLLRRRSFGSFSWTPQGRRRRARTRHATVVSDTFVNECICCCAIV